VILTVALVISMSGGSAQAASSRGLGQPAASGAAAAGSGLAPCTKPLFGPDKDCESTSPIVDRWVTFAGSSESCTYREVVDWGDGHSSTHIFVDPAPNVVLLIASHIYNPIIHATYTETVTNTVVSGQCATIPNTTFHFTHVLAAVAPSLDGQSLGGLGISKDCQNAILGDLAARLGKKFEKKGILRGLFDGLGHPQLLKLLVGVGELYLVIDFIHSCVEQPTTGLSPLPKAFSYGASHPGKLFKPSGRVPQIPHINGIYGYQKSVLDYFSLTYADPGHDAKGFGFVGIKGAGWAEENHPFSSPSYGIVGKDRIDYPFNLGCGTSDEYKSYVEAWIYDSQGLRSNPVEVDLSCTT
jgi:hypothetical protein